MALHKYCVLSGIFVIFNSVLGVLNKLPYINIMFCLDFFTHLVIFNSVLGLAVNTVINIPWVSIADIFQRELEKRVSPLVGPRRLVSGCCLLALVRSGLLAVLKHAFTSGK